MNHQFITRCGLLRVFDGFDTDPDPEVPPFRYDHGDNGLWDLRERYGLDDVAGGGDDVSRALNLLYWLSANACHNGNISQRLTMDAISLLEYAFKKGEERGINCRMLATILAEAYLAIGLEARIVSIHPINPYDFDNHVVTIVWAATMEKWIMVDPSFCAYVTDKDGVILSPWEIRDRMVRHHELRCNAEISHNGESYSPEEYLTYLAKDLFYMHSPVHNGFGSETRPDQKWVTLQPLGFDAEKCEIYNRKWRQHRENGPWETEELERLVAEKRAQMRGTRIYTSSLASFAKPPMER